MIDRADAIEIARSRAAEMGWAFAEPLEVVHRRGWFGRGDRFEIETNAGKRGTKARFVIDATTGTIADAKIVPPTSQNQRAIEDDLRDVVGRYADLDDEALRNLCEQTIRNYDPCISCATHFLALEVDRR